MIKYFSLIPFLLFFFDNFEYDKIYHINSTIISFNNPNKIKSEYPGAGESPVKIYYGFNESHSNDWAQINIDDVVGLTYFKRIENSLDEGTLLYQSINPDGSIHLDTITTGKHFEISVLLFDSLANPNVFVASSTDIDQIIIQYHINWNGDWQADTIMHFQNEGGKFIYELSADTGPDYSFHLLILKTQSNIDSDDFFDAFINSHLYYMTNVSGMWQKELIHNYDMVYTYDMYIKTLFRQDLKIDKEGYAHVAFGEQINANNHPDPSRLRYATNKTGTWKIETAFSNIYGEKDDAGWFPSLCLDTSGTPYISCMYVNRVSTGSAEYCKLFLLARMSDNNWRPEIIAEYDDGYYGTDGRKYTGALSHLVIDKNNLPNIIFSDVASSHWAYQNGNIGNLLLVGNIRYGILVNGSWNIKTIYNQPLPESFANATEMHGMCLLLPKNTDTVRIVGQELKITGWGDQYICNLVNIALRDTTFTDCAPSDCSLIREFKLFQNYPNPFNPRTNIRFDIPTQTHVRLEVFNVLGSLVKILVDEIKSAGSYTMTWDGRDYRSNPRSTGIYFVRLKYKDLIQVRKMLMMK